MNEGRVPAAGDCSRKLSRCMGGQEPFDFGAYRRIAGASASEECRPICCAAFQGRMEHGLDACPLLSVHGAVGRNSAYSQAFASVHSRPTVAVEMFITSAVSSMVSPPKKRNSTTRLC